MNPSIQHILDTTADTFRQQFPQVYQTPPSYGSNMDIRQPVIDFIRASQLLLLEAARQKILELKVRPPSDMDDSLYPVFVDGYNQAVKDMSTNLTIKP